MTSPRRARIAAASLVLGVTGALLSTVDGPASAGPTPSTAPVGSAPAASADRKRGGKVHWDSTYFYVGTAPVAAHGKIRGGKKKVKLQVKAGRGWKTIDADRTNRKGKFRVAGKLDWYGKHRVRVTTSGRKPFRRSTKVTVVPPYTPRGNPRDHVFTKSSGLKYTFNPCRTVRYAVNADDVGPYGIQMVQAAMAQVSWATGIKVKYVGTSHEIPEYNERVKLPRNQDLIVAWADQQEIPEFVTRPAIGFGGPEKSWLARTSKGKRVWMIDTASVVLDTTSYYSGNYTQGFAGTKPTWGETILHELGHAFGLAHSPAWDEIMYYQAGNGIYPDGLFRGLYGAGDIAGLNNNGLDQGCLKKVRGRTGVGYRSVTPTPTP